MPVARTEAIKHAIYCQRNQRLCRSDSFTLDWFIVTVLFLDNSYWIYFNDLDWKKILEGFLDFMKHLLFLILLHNS